MYNNSSRKFCQYNVKSLRNRFSLLRNHLRDLYRTHEIIVFELIFTPSSIIIHMIHKDQGKILGQSEAKLLANQKRIFKIFQSFTLASLNNNKEALTLSTITWDRLNGIMDFPEGQSNEYHTSLVGYNFYHINDLP